MKRCSKCGVDKSFDDFYKDRTKQDGLTPSCKVCKKEYCKNNKEKLKEKSKKYYYNNRDRLLKTKKEWGEKNKDIVRDRNKKWCDNNPDKVANNTAKWQKIIQIRLQTTQQSGKK